MNVRGLCLSEKLPCVDNLDYCNEFGKEVCDQEQYGQYMREHCRKFCNFCRGNSFNNYFCNAVIYWQDNNFVS